MSFFVRCLYRVGGAEDRLPIRREHIIHMLHWLPRTIFGAALRDEVSGDFIGMVVALDVPTIDEARTFITTEPYCRAGLFESIQINPMAQMTPPYSPELLEGELDKCL